MSRSGPCPFCGEKRPRVVPHHRMKGIFYVYCNICKAHGPIGVSKEDAREQWNERLTPAQAKAEDKRFMKLLSTVFKDEYTKGEVIKVL